MKAGVIAFAFLHLFPLMQCFLVKHKLAGGGSFVPMRGNTCFYAKKRLSPVREDLSSEKQSDTSVILDPTERTFTENDPENEAQKMRELRKRMLEENQQLQRIFDEQKKKRSMYGEANIDDDSLALEAAREQYERIQNRADDQIRLRAQLNQLSLESRIEDGKEFWEHPLYQELGITLPNPRGKTPEEFDLVENIALLQSSFLGLRPSPQYNNSMSSSDNATLSEIRASDDGAVDPAFQKDSVTKRFSKFYPYGFYGHAPLLSLKSPFDIFGNLHSQPRQYYKLLPTLDAFRLTQEFWRQYIEREEDLAALWYAEDHSKEKNLKQLSPWIRAALFSLDNDNGTDQDINDKVINFIEALIYGVIFVVFVDIILGVSNGIFNFLFREEFEFFYQNEWWNLPVQEILSHLPKFEPVQLSTFSKSLYGITATSPG